MSNYRLSVVLLLTACIGVDSVDEVRAAQEPEPPKVVVAKPIERMVSDFQDFTGRAVPAARIRNVSAEVELCKLNLEFTKVTAPIDGRIGRRLVDAGNLAVDDGAALTTIVGEGPMYVDFNVDELTLLHLRRVERERKSQEIIFWPIQMGLADETDFPHQSKVAFVDSRVDPQNGSVPARAEFPNPKSAAGIQIPMPGMFVRVRLFTAAPYKAQMVLNEAILADQGLHYVYVLDAENKVQYRRVLVGQARGDGMSAIKQGLRPDEYVLVRRLKGLRSGLTVRSEKIDMPAPAAPANSNPQP